MTKLLKQTHESPIKPVNGSRKLFERELSSGSPTQLSWRVSLPFRAFPCVHTALDTTCTPTFPIPRVQEGKWRSTKIVAHAKLAAASPGISSPSTCASTRKMARATKHVYERGKRIWHNNGRLYLGYTGGLHVIFDGKCARPVVPQAIDPKTRRN